MITTRVSIYSAEEKRKREAERKDSVSSVGAAGDGTPVLAAGEPRHQEDGR